MGRLKRALAALTTPADEQLAESEQLEERGVELTVEQRLDRVEVEIGDLWEHLRRWSARQAARARRDIEAQDRDTETPAAAPAPPINGGGPLVPGSKAWRDHQKSLIRGGH